jgi:hypothetical protein
VAWLRVGPTTAPRDDRFVLLSVTRSSTARDIRVALEFGRPATVSDPFVVVGVAT